MKIVDVLFARKDSIYKSFPECDVWDADRDVRNYEPTGRPVICHPPCRLWGNLRQFVKKPDIMEHCWPWWCIDLIDQYGEVLEHPATSLLWRQVQATTVIDQYWYGHRAQKRTGLYINGNIPPIPYTLAYPEPNVVNNKMGTAAREHTPPDFAKWLIEAATGK